MTTVYTQDTMGGMWRELDAGKRVELDERLFDYFLDVLPPRFMGRTVELVGGEQVYAAFGQAEGDGVPIVAFWKRTGFQTRYFAENTKLRTRG